MQGGPVVPLICFQSAWPGCVWGRGTFVLTPSLAGTPDGPEDGPAGRKLCLRDQKWKGKEAWFPKLALPITRRGKGPGKAQR